MQLNSTRAQNVRDLSYNIWGSIESGGTPQLLLPEAISRSMLLIQNTSDTDMYVKWGSAVITASLTGDKVTSCTVVDGGFGFTRPPRIQFLGGGTGGNSAFLGANTPGYPAPSHPATAQCVLTADVVTSVVIDDPGSGYISAPMVRVTNDQRDPYGCATPAVGSGYRLVLGGGSLFVNGTTCFTDQIAIFCATGSKTFALAYLP